MVRTQTCSICHKMYQSLWQTFSSFDFLYSSHKKLPRQYCHVRNTTQHCRLGLFQDSDFAGDHEDSKSTSEGILCIARKSNSCSHKLDVQEVNVSVSRFHRIGNYFVGYWFANGWILSLDLWDVDVVIEVLHSSNNRKSFFQWAGRTLLTKFQHKSWKKKGNRNVDQVSDLDHVVINASSFQMWGTVLHFWRQRSDDENDHQRKKSNDETRVQKPQSRVRLIV